MYHLSLVRDFDFFNEKACEFYTRAKYTPYQNPLWLTLIQRILTKGKDVFTLCIYHTDTLVGLLPLTREKQNGLTIVKMIDFEVSDENDIILDPLHLTGLIADKTFKEQFIKALKPCDVFILDKAIAIKSHLLHIFPQLKTHNYRYSTHKIDLNAPFEILRETHYNGTHRRSLDKKLSKLSRKGKLVFEELHDTARITQAFQDFIKFRAFRFKDQNTDIIQNPLYQEFYLNYALEGAKMGFARTTCLSLDGVNLAVIIGLTCDKSYQVVMLGFDREKYANFSPGLVIVDKAIEDGLKRGETSLDLTLGDEPYKYLFGVDSTPVSALYQPLTLKGKAYALARYKGALIKRWILAKREAWLKKGHSSPHVETPTQVDAPA